MARSSLPLEIVRSRSVLYSVIGTHGLETMYLE
jgi:hypothetical protein